MKKLFLYILIAFSLLFLSGCYTKLTVQEDYVKSDSTEAVTTLEYGVIYAPFYNYADPFYYDYMHYPYYL